MSERYFITGVQLGMIQALGKDIDLLELVEEIIEEQFVGQMPEPYEDYEVIIKKKAGKKK